MDVVVARCAGLDVHKDTVVACVRTSGPGGERVSETRTFGTFTVDLLALRDWLLVHGVTVVGMESTGVFWRPVFYTLEDAMECQLLNAAHMRNVPGRKTDVADAAWIAQLVEHGLVRPSFVPPPPIRELRELTRYRKSQIEERTREAQRLDKSLQDAGLKLSSVASDILGRSGRDMLDALVSGTRDAEVLAELARGRLRSKIPALTRALTGRFGPTHALVVGEILAHLDYLDEAISRVSARIDEVIRPFATERELLTTIPGVDKRLAEAMIAEIGVDMTRFGTAGRLASWAGVCPGQHESAGKSRSGRARHGDTHLQKHLAVAAMAAAHTKDTYLAAQYARLIGRRGKARARKAVGHSILVAAFHILAGAVPYAELGGDYYLKRNNPQRRARKTLNDLRSLGWTVLEAPDGVICTPPKAA
jgi:transposase